MQRVASSRKTSNHVLLKPCMHNVTLFHTSNISVQTVNCIVLDSWCIFLTVDSLRKTTALADGGLYTRSKLASICSKKRRDAGVLQLQSGVFIPTLRISIYPPRAQSWAPTIPPIPLRTSVTNAGVSSFSFHDHLHTYLPGRRNKFAVQNDNHSRSFDAILFSKLLPGLRWYSSCTSLCKECGKVAIARSTAFVRACSRFYGESSISIVFPEIIERSNRTSSNERSSLC